MDNDKNQSKFMKTGFSHYSNTSSMLGNDIESQKRRSVKKILLMSSMDKDIMKVLLKILQGGAAKHLTKDTKEQL